MAFLIFNLVMLSLALMAQYRCPRRYSPPVLWFFMSWLPSELPWLFARVQILVSAIWLLFSSRSADPLLQSLSLIVFILSLGYWYFLHRKTFRAKRTLQKVLDNGLGQGFEFTSAAPFDMDLPISADNVSQHRHWLKPFSFHRPGIERLRDIAYGEDPLQKLDIVRATQPSSPRPRPVLLHIHGGGWILGKKNQQALPLINYLAAQGWICVDINYRLAPKHRLPAALIDVKMAIAWTKQHIADFGGDSDFIAVVGESAGGHLCALTALTENDPEFQPGFTEVDTRIQVAVPVYGIYDFTSRAQTSTGKALHRVLTRYVMPESYSAAPELWQKLSPLLRITANTPPMLVIQGTHDSLALVEDTRRFIAALKQQSNSPILYAEIGGAQHGFDIFHAVRTEFTIETIGQYLLYFYTKAKQPQS